jgi:hypothetical protein
MTGTAQIAPENVVTATPTKRFFVSMLVRDIELADAILDLLDNCIDGAQRTRRGQPEIDLPYSGFEARINAEAVQFVISDNCGGIDRETARSVAFRMGRPDPERDDDIQTVGVYGIGMKRAIFKMGQHAVVTSCHNGNPIEVEITPEWMKDDAAWDLELRIPAVHPSTNGTKIVVDHLHTSVAAELGDEHGFLVDLREKISSIYSVLIDKGFAVFLNDSKIRPRSTSFHALAVGETPGIRPYVWRGTIEGVDVTVAVGFRSRLAKEEEVEEQIQEERAMRRSAEEAGWTVICNDRVVLFNDRTERTGWGTADVPAYHNQFISITGIVSFDSKFAELLPLTTTKRNLDRSSLVYIKTLDIMRVGIKKFTSFTNKWKGQEEGTNAYFASAPLLTASQVLKEYGKGASSATRRIEGQASRPNLPEPQQERQRRRIAFFRDASEIATLGRHYFDDANARPGEVGEAAFDDAMKRARG